MSAWRHDFLTILSASRSRQYDRLSSLHCIIPWHSDSFKASDRSLLSSVWDNDGGDGKIANLVVANQLTEWS